MDKNQNRKKRRSRGEGVTSYRVTSSLTLTDEAYQQQQRIKQQRVVQPPSYSQPAPQSPFDMQGQPGQQQQAYPGYEQQQQQSGYDPGYYPQTDPHAAQSYYDQPAEGGAQPYAQGYEAQTPYDQQTYYDQQTGQAYDANGYPQQQGYDQNAQTGYDAQGYYDENGNYVQSYDASQQGYDQNAQSGYEAQGYYDENGNYVYDQQQGYAQPGYEGQYDQQGQYYDPQNPEAQGYYDENGNYIQGSYDQQYAQGYYDENGNYVQGYAQPGYEGQYDQQGYYDQQQGYGDPNDPNYYPQPGDQPSQLPPRKRKYESVQDVYSQMLGEGHTYATDSDDSPHHEQVKSEEAFYQKQYPANSAYPPPHLVPQSPWLQMLGPVADIYLKLRELWVQLSSKTAHYTDMLLDLQESVQKELKEAASLAFKGFIDQMKQRSPIALPYQQVPGAPPGAQPGAAPGQAYNAPAPQQPPVSFVDLQELNVEFTDNYDQPLFDFSKYAGSQYKVSKAIADPAAMESALWAIRECAPRAGAIPPAQEGPYANLPLTEVMNNITEQDLMAFLRYVKAYPGNYVSRALKVSETFATWVVYGAPQP